MHVLTNSSKLINYPCQPIRYTIFVWLIHPLTCRQAELSRGGRPQVSYLKSKDASVQPWTIVPTYLLLILTNPTPSTQAIALRGFIYLHACYLYMYMWMAAGEPTVSSACVKIKYMHAFKILDHQPNSLSPWNRYIKLRKQDLLLCSITCTFDFQSPVHRPCLLAFDLQLFDDLHDDWWWYIRPWDLPDLIVKGNGYGWADRAIEGRPPERGRRSPALALPQQQLPYASASASSQALRALLPPPEVPPSGGAWPPRRRRWLAAAHRRGCGRVQQEGTGRRRALQPAQLVPCRNDDQGVLGVHKEVFFHRRSGTGGGDDCLVDPGRNHRAI